MTGPVALEQFLQLPEVKPALEYHRREGRSRRCRRNFAIVSSRRNCLLGLNAFARARRARARLSSSFGARLRWKSLVLDLSFFVRGSDARAIAIDESRRRASGPRPRHRDPLAGSDGRRVASKDCRLRSGDGVQARLVDPSDSRSRSCPSARTRKPKSLGLGDDPRRARTFLPGFALSPLTEMFGWLERGLSDRPGRDPISRLGEHDPAAGPEAVAEPGGSDRPGADGVDRQDLVDPEAGRAEVPRELAPGEEVDLHPGDPPVGHPPVADVGPAERATRSPWPISQNRPCGSRRLSQALWACRASRPPGLRIRNASASALPPGRRPRIIPRVLNIDRA